MAKKRKKAVKISADQVNPWVLAQIVAQQNPKPARITPVVRHAVSVGFSAANRPEALALLRGYHGPETPRVHRAVLALSDGKLARLKTMVDAANDDYRDVLFWAEYPEESISGTQQQKRAAVRRMAARWRKMGLPVPEGD